MGRYTDWDIIANQFPLVSRGPSADEVNSFFVVYAEAELDGILAPYYTVPFSSNNITAQQLATLGTYIKLGILRDQQLQPLKDMYDARIARLKNGEEYMISTTGSSTYVEIPPSDGTTGVAASTTEDYHPVFGMGDIIDFQVDSMQLEDEENRRD